MSKFSNQAKINLTVLQLIAVLTAISGVLALIFEVRNLVIHSFEVYISRLSLTVFAFIILVLSNTNTGKSKTNLLLHFLLFTVIASSFFVVTKITNLFAVNSNVLAFYVFLVGISIRWHYINQIIVVMYLILSIIGVQIVNPGVYTSHTNFIETISIVSVLCVLSIIASILLGSKIQIEPETEELGEKDDLHFDDFVNNAAEGFFRISVDSKFIYANLSLVKLLGYSNVDEVINLNDASKVFANGSDLSDLKKIVDKSERVKNFRSLLVRPDGTKISVKINARKVNHDKRAEIYYEGSIADITSQVKLENESKAEIEKLKEENNRIEQEAAAALRSSEIKTQFLANMGHEIRTPMNSVFGLLSLIEDGQFETLEELKEYAVNAKSAAGSLMDIINNVLDISNIEAGKMDLSEIEFDLTEEINKAVSIIGQRAREKGLGVTVNIAGDIPVKIIGDAMKYRQVLINLLSNAIKFTETGEVSVEVATAKKTEDTIQLNTIVQDSGCGIPKEKLEMIFGEYKENNENGVPKNGVGLGLMICKEFVNLMDGTIEIESKINEGTTVSFSVIFGLIKDLVDSPKQSAIKIEHVDKSKKKEPEKIIEKKLVEIKKENSREESSDSKTTLGIAAEKSLIENFDKIEEKYSKKAEEIFSSTTATDKDTKSGKKRLLLVEDNPISQKVEQKLLTGAGYAVDAVSSGKLAIEAVKSEPFDLILMDIEMEGMDGIEATKRIRALEVPINEIPIIAVTAHSSMKDRERCLDAGMNDYIAKPININFLKMTIDQWLYRK
ncbi:MAG: response regulator [Melioribacteraceae bacterium]|nr:response regulator [Melioribacteraceae bacterium]